MEAFVKVASTNDLPSGGLMLIEIQDKRIVLTNVDGKYYALADLCTHAECPLSDGELDSGTLVCPCHGSRFDVRTGEAMTPPAIEPLTCYEVRIDGQDIMIESPIQ